MSLSAPQDFETLKEFETVFTQEKNLDNNYVSLFDVLDLIKKKEIEYNALKKELNDYVLFTMEDYYSRPYNPYSVVDFDFEQNMLTISKNGRNSLMHFMKKDGNLFFIKENSYNEAKKVLIKCGNIISKYIDNCIILYKDFFVQTAYNINSINSDFIINIDNEKISIRLKNSNNSINFELSLDIATKKYHYDCISNNLISILNERENKFFQRIFVKIEDCPEWMQSGLYVIRDKELEIEKKKIRKK